MLPRRQKEKEVRALATCRRGCNRLHCSFHCSKTTASLLLSLLLLYCLWDGDQGRPPYSFHALHCFYSELFFYCFASLLLLIIQFISTVFFTASTHIYFHYGYECCFHSSHSFFHSFFPFILYSLNSFFREAAMLDLDLVSSVLKSFLTVRSWPSRRAQVLKSFLTVLARDLLTWFGV